MEATSSGWPRSSPTSSPSSPTIGMANPEEVMGAIQQVVEGGMQRGGHRGGVEAFCRFVDGDEAFENLDPQLRERMLRNGETCLVTEMPVFPAYAPDEATLAAVEVPVRVMVGPDSAIGEPAGWLAGKLGVELERLPGGHPPYFDRPQEMAEALRPMLRELSKQPV